MKFDRELRPATETSWVISYGGKPIPRWRTAAILKIVILPYLSEKSSDFDEILYTASDFELDERHVIKNEKVAIGQTRSLTERVSCFFNFLFSFTLTFSLATFVNRIYVNWFLHISVYVSLSNVICFCFF